MLAEGDAIQSLLSSKPSFMLMCGLCSAAGDVGRDAIQSLLSLKPVLIVMCGLCSAAGDVARGRYHPVLAEFQTNADCNVWSVFSCWRCCQREIPSSPC